MKIQIKQTFWAMAVMVGVVTATGASYAQAPAAQQKAEPVVVPLKVTVVITRHKSDKAQTVVSRLPYEVWVNTGSAATIRFGSEVPVPTTMISQDEATKKSTPVTSFTYRPVGMNLTVEARALGDGRFSIPVSIEDTQILPLPEDSTVGLPKTGTQSIRTQTTVVLRDGQTVQHSLATDRVTGDVTRVEVTLNVVK